MFSTVSLKTLGGVLVMALLSGIWWHGYKQGAASSTERCAATIIQLREAFAQQEKQRAEQAAQSLQALQQRFTHQVKAANQAEQHYLNRIAQLRDKTQHLTRRIDDVPHIGRMKKARLMLWPAYLLVASCSTTTPPSGCQTLTVQALPPLPAALATRPGQLRPLASDTDRVRSPSAMSSPISSTTANSARSGGHR
ncbi:hypothetical protein CBG25_17075 [Arsenophonus sp. ENCA]|uniref:hypothetical protein n=1 Tax=Arsenophonus sp. ENCA TaxID=1987579 RepID=UPI000BC937EB|nr:hypothetical protein [Arsenophonus sp. ENCA]PAV01363.1 hypothetical protein CBG25_17075 [Arsenophonus sp. ENCA]